MRDNVRTIVFATVLGLVCSLLLTAASLLTTPYREANEKADEVRNFLSALEVPIGQAADSKALLDVFNRNIRVTKMDNITLYEYVPDPSSSDRPVAIAVPFSGPGLWGPIRGVLALEPDLVAIRGIRFYKQEETPGLGGEIGAGWFEKQFEGKQIVSDSGKPGFQIRKAGTSHAKNCVDAITGATMTSDRVQEMLDKLAVELGKVRDEHGK